jgi:hypothetical protein
MIENVLVPVDGSEDANKAIEFTVDSGNSVVISPCHVHRLSSFA